MKNLYAPKLNRNSSNKPMLPYYVVRDEERDSVFSAYSHSSVVTLQKYSAVQTRSNLSWHPSPWILKQTFAKVLDKDKSIHHLNELSIAGYSLKLNSGLSMDVEIERHADSMSAYNHTFGIYGFGNTKEEALEDFNNAFITFYKDIMTSPDIELGDSTIEFKRTLETFASLLKRG